MNHQQVLLSAAMVVALPGVMQEGLKAEMKAGAREILRPNVIFILADDLGYAELGCYGNTFNETPHLDRLAKNGLRFTNAYAAQTVSSPTRAALMTGMHPARTGIIDYLRPDDSLHLDEQYTTLPEVFRMAGYSTCIIGKWHLTGYTRAGARYESSPDKHGFDEVIVSENQGIGGGTYFHPYHFNEDVEKKLAGDKEFLVDRLNDEAVNYIERRSADEPFFLYLSHYAVHTTLHGKPEDVEYFRRKAQAGKSAPSAGNKANDPYKKWPADFRAERNNPHLAAQLREIDRGVGAILAKLEEKGLLENTIVVFTSDNGGELSVTTNAPLRAGKSHLYEGGIREPLIISASALLPPGGVSDEKVITYDFLPTFCSMLQYDTRAITQKMDGVTLWPLLTGKVGKLRKRELFWHYPLERPHFLGGRSSAAIQHDGWKLIRFYDTGELELYNLESDPGETTNQLEQQPRKARKLLKRLNAHLR